ncbi:hypothetical protein AB1Y20_012854 [Prymnesium parvum]|uniref:Uncharacterized protein n=1 Tax=Prymnesium parvum TaxID=97485 RepID=A0AB34IJU0_PRYPA
MRPLAARRLALDRSAVGQGEDLLREGGAMTSSLAAAAMHRTDCPVEALAVEGLEEGREEAAGQQVSQMEAGLEEDPGEEGLKEGVDWLAAYPLELLGQQAAVQRAGVVLMEEALGEAQGEEALGEMSHLPAVALKAGLREGVEEEGLVEEGLEEELVEDVLKEEGRREEGREEVWALLQPRQPKAVGLEEEGRRVEGREVGAGPEEMSHLPAVALKGGLREGVEEEGLAEEGLAEEGLEEELVEDVLKEEGRREEGREEVWALLQPRQPKAVGLEEEGRRVEGREVGAGPEEMSHLPAVALKAGLREGVKEEGLEELVEEGPKESRLKKYGLKEEKGLREKGLM